MKRLLHIIAQKPEKTGSGIFVCSVISEASQRGYEQGLVAGVSAMDDLQAMKELGDIGFYPVYFDTEELPFPVVGMSDVMPYQSTRYCDLDHEKLIKWRTSFIKEIENAINEFKPEIIISHHLWLLSSLVCTAAVAKNIPVICVCHGTDLRQMELSPNFGTVVKEGLQTAKLVLSLTEHQAVKMKECFGINHEKIRIIGAAYNSSIFYADPNKKNNDKKIKLIYAGKLSFSKGVLSLIKAYSMLSDIEDVELMIVGSGTGDEEVFIKKAVIQCKNKIVLIEAIKQSELAELFRQSDVFILPSFYEGLPLVVLEALACGIRVVVSDLPGLRQWVGNELNSTRAIEYISLPKMSKVDIPDSLELPCFESKLSQSMQNQITSIRNNELLPKLKIKELMKKHSWNEMLNKLENIFDEVKI